MSRVNSWKSGCVGASLLLFLACSPADGLNGSGAEIETAQEPILGGSTVNRADRQAHYNAVVGLDGKLGTGLLVAPRLVLTAGHCGAGPGTTGTVQFDYYDASGTLRTETLTKIQEIEHPSWPSENVDLGIWVLDRPSNKAWPYWNPTPWRDNLVGYDTNTRYGFGSDSTPLATTTLPAQAFAVGPGTFQSVYLSPPDQVSPDGVWASGSTTVRMTGSGGNADLYVRVGAMPTLSSYNCRPHLSSSNETCVVNVTGTQKVYAAVYGSSGTSTVSVTTSFPNRYQGAAGVLRKAWDCHSQSTTPYGDGNDWRFDELCNQPHVDVAGEGGDSGGPVFDADGAQNGVYIGGWYPAGFPQRDVVMYLGWTDETGSAPYIYWAQRIIDAYAATMFPGDYDGDGYADLLHYNQQAFGSWSDLSSATSTVPDGTADQLIDRSGSSWCPGGWVLITGKFDSNASTDLLCYEPGSGQMLIDYANAGRFSGTDVTIAGGWCTNGSLYAGDFNNDGVDDLFCLDSQGNRKLDINSKISTRPFAGSDWQELGSGWCGQQLLLGDFNRDGKKDLLCYDAGNYLYVRFASGSGTSISFGPTTAMSVSWCGQSLLVGDFNGDGATDILCRDTVNHSLQIDYANPSSTYPFGGPDWTQTGWSWCGQNMFAVDVNKDGWTDLMCYSPAMGVTWQTLNRKTGTPFDGQNDRIIPRVW